MGKNKDVQGPVKLGDGERSKGPGGRGTNYWGKEGMTAGHVSSGERERERTAALLA